MFRRFNYFMKRLNSGTVVFDRREAAGGTEESIKAMEGPRERPGLGTPKLKALRLKKGRAPLVNLTWSATYHW